MGQNQTTTVVIKKLSQVVSILQKGGIGVMPTDTIYGLVGSALNKKAVAKVYRVKRRTPTKPVIILISSLRDLEIFSVELTKPMLKVLNKFWPGPVSIILTCKNKKFDYLGRGTGTLAFRLPAKRSLRAFLKKTGPLVAPSANPEGLPPATTLRETESYFGNEIDFYYGRGLHKGKPSKLIEINENGTIRILRK